MFTKHHQRLLKELLMEFYRTFPHAIDWPVYYVPWDDKGIPEARLAVRTMQALKEVPWPEDTCIVVAEESLSSIVYEGDADSLVAYAPIEMDHRPPNIDGLYYYMAVTIEDGRIKFKRSFFGLRRLLINDQFVTASSLNVDSFLGEVVRRLEHEYQLKTPVLRHRMKEFSRLLLPQSGREQWIAFGLDIDDERQIMRTKGEVSPMTASDMFLHMSNMVFPSHYIVRSSFREGFGSPSMKKKTKGKPFFSVISFDRLYGALPQKDPEYQVRPHFRRRHPRHLWKKVGLDRFKLPKDPLARALLVEEHCVPTIIIPPMWIGNPEFATEGVDHRIITEKLEMRGYRLELSKKIS
jgi:hypothetical protein